ncbi:MAG: hypothetical protein K2K68_09380 [Duncaniella sp.]|nr:hypothetical protein [Duncaniella sp.]
MKYTIIFLSLMSFALSLSAQRYEYSGFSFYIPQPAIIYNSNSLSYPNDNGKICAFLHSNLLRIASINEQRRNVHDLSQSDKEFIRLIEVMSDKECINIGKGHGYGWNTKVMDFPDDRVKEIQDWIENYCEVITVEIISEARRLLVPVSADENIRRLNARIIARKEYLDSLSESGVAPRMLPDDLQSALRRIDEKFANIAIHSVYLDEYEKNQLKKLLQLICADSIDDDFNTLTIDRLTEIQEKVFRYTH